jgi:hypothetical protein
VIGWISSQDGASDTSVDTFAKLIDVSGLEELQAEVDHDRTHVAARVWSASTTYANRETGA